MARQPLGVSQQGLAHFELHPATRHYPLAGRNFGHSGFQLSGRPRVRRHRERRRDGLRLFTVTIPATVIENAKPFPTSITICSAASLRGLKSGAVSCS